MKRVCVFKIFILFLLIGNNNYCKAQSWQNVDGGIIWTYPIILYTGVWSMTNDTVHHYLYAGGAFDSAGHIPTQNLARWDGTNWSSIGNFNDTCIFALCMYNDTLVIGDYSGNIIFVDSAGNILHEFPSDDFIYTMVVYRNELYIGGLFDEINGVAASAIARYNGSTWESVDSGMQSCCKSGVYSLYVWNNKLYAGGLFNQAGDTMANNIASWNDTTWAPLGNGISEQGSSNAAEVIALASYNNNLYACGIFDTAGNTRAKGIAKWDGKDWNSLNGTLNNPIVCMMSFQNFLYVSGSFDSAGSIQALGVAKWNDTTFSAVDGGFPQGYAEVIDTFNRGIYFGGNFDTAGYIPVNNLDRLTTDTATSIVKISQLVNKQLNIYPNPTSGQFTIRLNDYQNGYTVEVYTVMGEKIYQSVLSNSESVIDLSSQPSGLYFVYLKSDDSVEIGKVLVTK